jgi:hypothetical protein
VGVTRIWEGKYVRTRRLAGDSIGPGDDIEAPLGPFPGITVGDANTAAVDTLRIALSNRAASGALADAAGVTCLVADGSGVYTLVGTAAIASELKALVFTPIAGQSNSATMTTLAFERCERLWNDEPYQRADAVGAFGRTRGTLPPAGLISDAAEDRLELLSLAATPDSANRSRFPRSSVYGTAQTLVTSTAPTARKPSHQ